MRGRQRVGVARRVPRIQGVSTTQVPNRPRSIVVNISIQLRVRVNELPSLISAPRGARPQGVATTRRVEAFSGQAKVVTVIGAESMLRSTTAGFFAPKWNIDPVSASIPRMKTTIMRWRGAHGDGTVTVTGRLVEGGAMTENVLLGVFVGIVGWRRRELLRLSEWRRGVFGVGASMGAALFLHHRTLNARIATRDAGAARVWGGGAAVSEGPRLAVPGGATGGISSD